MTGDFLGRTIGLPFFGLRVPPLQPNFCLFMDTKITRDIRVSVETNYQMNYSNPLENKYIFSYSVTIENRGRDTVRLLRRHWNIIDATAIHRVVNGDGVVGQQPILEPGNTYQYSSWCHLLSDVGRMWGTYFFERMPGGEEFEVDIPEFMLIAPFKSN